MYPSSRFNLPNPTKTIFAIYLKREGHSMKKKIVVLGSINFDVVARSNRLPKEGETVGGTAVDMFIGGKGSNQATQASLLGMETHFIGQIGRDEMGSKVINSLINQGVDCRYLQTSYDHSTGCASIYVDDEGRNMLVHAPGANHHIPTSLVDESTELIKSATVFITQNEINQDVMIEGLKLASGSGSKTLLNPAPAVNLPEEVFTLIDYITPNETESEEYTGILRKDYDLDLWKRKNAEWFINRGVKNVCITLGEDGCYYYDGKIELNVPAFKIEPIDTTAAGDSFNGGLAYGVAIGLPIKQALQLGNACGALATISIGAQNSIANKKIVSEFLQKQGLNIDLE